MIQRIAPWLLAVAAAAAGVTWFVLAAFHVPSYPAPEQDPAAAHGVPTVPPNLPLSPTAGNLAACDAFTVAEEGRMSHAALGAAVARLRVSQSLELPLMVWLTGGSLPVEATVAEECGGLGIIADFRCLSKTPPAVCPATLP